MSRALVRAATAAVAFSLLASPAGAQSTGSALGVSVPPEPMTARPGETVDLPVRVTNPGDAAVVVRVEQRALDFGNEGRVRVLDRPDPLWAPHLMLPAEPVEIPAQGYRELAFTLRVPDVAPDTYLVGFLVAPVVTGPGVQVVAAAGSYVAIDVPGPRDRRLDVALAAPRVVWGGSTEARLVATNTGRSSLRFWGEHGRERIGKTLLPTGLHRSLPVPVRSKFGIGVQQVAVRVFYNHTDNQVVERTASQRVLFVHPAYPLAVAALALVVLARFVRSRRRRRRSTANQPTP